MSGPDGLATPGTERQAESEQQHRTGQHGVDRAGSAATRLGGARAGNGVVDRLGRRAVRSRRLGAGQVRAGVDRRRRRRLGAAVASVIGVRLAQLRSGRRLPAVVRANHERVRRRVADPRRPWVNRGRALGRDHRSTEGVVLRTGDALLRTPHHCELLVARGRRNALRGDRLGDEDLAVLVEDRHDVLAGRDADGLRVGLVGSDGPVALEPFGLDDLAVDLDGQHDILGGRLAVDHRDLRVAVRQVADHVCHRCRPVLDHGRRNLALDLGEREVPGELGALLDPHALLGRGLDRGGGARHRVEPGSGSLAIQRVGEVLVRRDVHPIGGDATGGLALVDLGRSCRNDGLRQGVTDTAGIRELEERLVADPRCTRDHEVGHRAVVVTTHVVVSGTTRTLDVTGGRVRPRGAERARTGTGVADLAATREHEVELGRLPREAGRRGLVATLLAPDDVAGGGRGHRAPGVAGGAGDVRALVGGIGDAITVGVPLAGGTSVRVDRLTRGSTGALVGRVRHAVLVGIGGRSHALGDGHRVGRGRGASRCRSDGVRDAGERLVDDERHQPEGGAARPVRGGGGPGELEAVGALEHDDHGCIRSTGEVGLEGDLLTCGNAGRGVVAGELEAHVEATGGVCLDRSDEHGQDGQDRQDREARG